MLLAIESSCDETSVALVHEGAVLSSLVSSQTKTHAEYGGVVPELASREHLRNLLPLSRAALNQAGVRSDEIMAIAATLGPGLPSALLVGARAAQSLAFALRKPFLGIHHHEAHLYSPWLQGSPPVSSLGQFQPNVSLIVSGGHTLLVLVKKELRHRVLGSTIDDAAGECFDKVAKLLGMAYPGGPLLDRLAQQGNSSAFAFPRPLLNEPNDDFSFSGLKTAVRYFLRDHPEILQDAARLPDLCASVQAAIVDVLVKKTVRAAKREQVSVVTASGGVTCNSALRAQLAEACRKERVELRLALPEFCTDNAAMIGILAERKFLRDEGRTDLDKEIAPNWSLEELTIAD